jgi:Prolyl 4-Hydroxylase alpha-subunit, N-terminal region
MKYVFLLSPKRRFLSVIKDEIRQAQGKENNYFGNPVNAHLFIKHLTADWYTVEETIAPGKSIALEIDYDERLLSI